MYFLTSNINKFASPEVINLYRFSCNYIMKRDTWSGEQY